MYGRIDLSVVGTEGATIAWSKHSTDQELLCIAGPEGVVVFDSISQRGKQIISSHCSSRCVSWLVSSASLIIAEATKLITLDITASADNTISSKVVAEIPVPVAGPIGFMHTITDDSLFIGTKNGSVSEMYEFNIKTHKAVSFRDDICARGYEDRSARLRNAFMYTMCYIKPW